MERSVDDCYRDTGKPPIPARWVVTNKGDGLHPNVRCRLVAKHTAAKYGGKDAGDLFAAMPPFKLIKSLLIKAVQRSSWKTMKRQVMSLILQRRISVPPWTRERVRMLTSRQNAASQGHADCCNIGCMACDLHRMVGKLSTLGS